MMGNKEIGMLVPSCIVVIVYDETIPQKLKELKENLDFGNL